MVKSNIILIDLDHTLYNVKFKKLYDDSIDFLNYITKKGKIVLFTEGEIKVQENKVLKLDLSRYFSEDIRIFDSYSKMAKTSNDYKNNKVFVIDDNPEVIREASKRGWTTIRILRGRYKKAQVKSDYTVTNLEEVDMLNLF